MARVWALLSLSGSLVAHHRVQNQVNRVASRIHATKISSLAMPLVLITARSLAGLGSNPSSAAWQLWHLR